MLVKSESARDFDQGSGRAENVIHYHLIAVLQVGIAQLDKDLSGFAFAGGLADCLKPFSLSDPGRLQLLFLKAFLMSKIQKTRIDNEVLTFECDYEPLLKLGL